METAGRDYRTTGLRLGLAVLLVLIALLVWWLRLRNEARTQGVVNERGASAMLRVIAAAEEEFRNGDRDNNGVQDYWTRDVAGLSRFNGRAARPGPLIPREVAAADGARAEGSQPYHGYSFKALPGGSPTKFAVCAYPTEYPRTGKWTFVLNEKREFFRVDTGGKAIDRWAPDPSTWIPME